MNQKIILLIGAFTLVFLFRKQVPSKMFKVNLNCFNQMHECIDMSIKIQSKVKIKERICKSLLSKPSFTKRFIFNRKEKLFNISINNNEYTMDTIVDMSKYKWMDIAFIGRKQKIMIDSTMFEGKKYFIFDTVPEISNKIVVTLFE